MSKMPHPWFGTELSKLSEIRQIQNAADPLLRAFSCGCFIYFASIKDNQYFIDCYSHFAPFRDMFLHTIIPAAQTQLGDYVHMSIGLWLNCFHINQNLRLYFQKHLKPCNHALPSHV